MNQRPISPFMLGPHYRLQLTSVLSFLHRITGVVLSVGGIPLILWWLMAVSRGPESYASLIACLSGVVGSMLVAACTFSLSFHFLNGIRHLVWDTGRWLDLANAYRSGWIVIAGSVVLTVVLTGAML